MRKTVIAGNWKMNKTLPETTELISGLKAGLGPGEAGVTVVICPPFTSLSLAAELIKGTPIRLGAQNLSRHDDGAYTGEISWRMLRSAGCEYVIVGHSERRQYSHETDELINEKARKSLDNALRPIICVGETLQEREAGVTQDVVRRQVRGVLAGLTASDMERVIIAYEPVWAIGTGRNATPVQAEEVHKLIRAIVTDMFDDRIANSLIIQYGGSVKPDNAAELLRQDDIDGALVGGACLESDQFLAIIRSAL